MGLFDPILDHSEPVEARLRRELTDACVLKGHSQAESTRMANDILDEAQRRVITRGLADERPNMGDWLIEQQSCNDVARRTVAGLRLEGVGDDDIRWWWNQSALERIAIEVSDEVIRMAVFLKSLKDGLDAKAAADELAKHYPRFGDPADGDGNDDSRPLPFELKPRVWDFQDRLNEVTDIRNRAINHFSSFNALVRDAIRRDHV